MSSLKFETSFFFILLILYSRVLTQEYFIFGLNRVPVKHQAWRIGFSLRHLGESYQVNLEFIKVIMLLFLITEDFNGMY